jgi:hypothetical protein
VSSHFEQRNERIKNGGVIMGNEMELMTHKESYLEANTVSKIDSSLGQHRRIYLDTLSADHICTTEVSELKPTLIKDLVKDVNHGRIIWVTIEEPCYSSSTLKDSMGFHSSNFITVLAKDSQDNLVSLALHNILLLGATTKDAEQYLPVGTRIGIKEPLYKSFLSGYLGLRVDNPCNLEILSSKGVLPDSRALSYDLFQQDSVDDFYGPIEIRDAGSKGRGVFLTEDVKEGDLLIVEKAFGFQFNEENMETTVINLKSRTFCSGAQINLVSELVIAASRNSTVNGILSLLDSGVRVKAPVTYDMLRSGRIPSSPQLSASTIDGIVHINGFEIRHKTG